MTSAALIKKKATLQTPSTWNLSWRQALPQVRRSLLLIYPCSKRQSATEWIASVKLYKCPNLQCNPCSSATEWTASVHTLHVCYGMPFSQLQRREKDNSDSWKATKTFTIIGQTMNIHTCYGINITVHTLHMPKPLDVKYSKCYGMYAVVHTLHTAKPVI